MAYLYIEIKRDDERVFVQRISDTAFIPLNEDNADYAEFLRLASLLGEENILEAAS